MSKKWYTSDQHFWHWNIINYCNRHDPETHQPFKSVERMNECLVERYNDTVGANDEVYFLGDVCFYSDKAIKLLEQMKGRKHLIIGNHDARKLAKWEGWETVGDYKEVKDEGRKVILCHYPIWSWNGMYKGTTHLHGHCHGTLKPWPGKRRCDVGVDVWQYRPMTLNAIQVNMEIQGHWKTEELDLNSERPSGRNM